MRLYVYNIFLKGVFILGGNSLSHLILRLSSVWEIGIMAIWIYSFYLFVKLAHRGITALDLYISEKRSKQ